MGTTPAQTPRETPSVELNSSQPISMAQPSPHHGTLIWVMGAIIFALLVAGGIAIWVVMNNKGADNQNILLGDTVKTPETPVVVPEDSDAQKIREIIKGYKKDIALSPTALEGYIVLAFAFDMYGVDSEDAKKIQTSDPETYRELPKILNQGMLRAAKDPRVDVLKIVFVEYYGRSGSPQDYERAIVAARDLKNEDLVAFAKKYIISKSSVDAKMQDASTMSSFGGARNILEEYFKQKKSYQGFCSDPTSRFAGEWKRINTYTTTECNDSPSAWAISAKLANGVEYWCTDNSITQQTSAKSGVKVSQSLGSRTRCQ